VKKLASLSLSSIVFINLFLKLVLFCYIAPWSKTVQDTKILVSDSKQYQQVAENLMHYHSFAPPIDTVTIDKFSELRATGYIMCHPDGWMMPVYSIFLAGVYSIAGVKPYIAILLQILLSLLSVVLVYRIALLLLNNSKISTIATLLFALDIQSIYASNEMLTETLFVLLFLAGVYYFLKGMLNGKLTSFCIGALFMGLACLTRLIALLYPTVLVLILLVFSQQKMKWRLKAAISYVAIFAFISAIWSFRNHSTYGHWQITTHGGWALAMYNAAFTKARITHENIDSIRVGFQRQADSMGFRRSNDMFNQSEIYNKIGAGYIMKHKGIYLLTHLQGGMNMFLSLGNMGMAKTLGWSKTVPTDSFAELKTQRVLQNFSSNIRETTLGLLILVLIAIQYIGAVYGIIKLIKVRNFMVLSLIILSAAYFTVITGAFGMYRFKLPLVPFICIAAGYGYFRQQAKEKQTN
jgi:4-amino-4-deoxy-L-arabinose transferase-like glycosyltransferase